MLKLSTTLLIILFSTLIYAQKATVAKPLNGAEREEILQKALQLRKEEKYTAAIKQLNIILASNKNDTQILLLKGDLLLESKNFSEAVVTYKKLLPLNFEKTIVTINLSYALFMNHKPVKALGYAKQAWVNDSNNKNATVNHFNAMLWNVKTNEAGIFLNQQQHRLDKIELTVLRARLYTTSGNFIKGIEQYDSLVKMSNNKYYVQECFEVLLSKNEVERAGNILKANEKLYSKNELAVLNDKFKQKNMQQLSIIGTHFKDIAENTKNEIAAIWQQNASKKFSWQAGASNATYVTINKEKTNATILTAQLNERWSRTLTGSSSISYQLMQPNNASSFDALLLKQDLIYKPNDRRMFGINYNKEVLNYTQPLLNKNIKAHNLGYVTHIMMDGKNGFYSQGGFGFLSDNNIKQHFFGSLYHLFSTNPTLKAGLNFSSVKFKYNATTDYFAPAKYLNAEVFADYTSIALLSKFYFQAQVGVGLQQIGESNWNNTFRLQTELLMTLKQFDAVFQYQTSNNASSIGSGYKYNSFMLKLVAKWL